MVITDIQEVNIGRSTRKKACKIYIDDNYAFLLKEQDLIHYQLSIGTEITLDFYETIIENTEYPMAKQKALNLIKHSDKTEQEIYYRLKEEYYPDEIIERVVGYLKSYNYLNDERYARNYIRYRKTTESKRAVELKLINKGINKQVLEKIISEEYESFDKDSDPEVQAIIKFISKKCIEPTSLSFEEKQKLINILYRKGFDLYKINKCL